MSKLITRLALTSILGRVKGINEDKEVFVRYGNSGMCSELTELSESLTEIYQFVSLGIIDGSFRFNSKGTDLPVMNNEYVVNRSELDILMVALGMVKKAETTKKPTSPKSKKEEATSKLFVESKKRQDVAYKPPRVMEDIFRTLFLW